MSSTSSNEYKKRDLNLDIGFERFEEDFHADPNTMFILQNEPKDKPIKIVFEDDVKVTANGNDIEIKRKLSDIEAEKLLIDIFGTTNVGILDCSDMTDEKIEKFVDKWNDIPEEYLTPVVDWAKLDCLTMSEEQFTKIYCSNCGTQRCEGIYSEWFDGCKFKDHLSRSNFKR